MATVPDEERASYAAVSGQSLFYMGKRSLRHRLLSIAEEAGAEKASHALKLLQSSKELLIASTGKDHLTGRITLHEYKVEGPVALMITTSKVVLDDEALQPRPGRRRGREPVADRGGARGAAAGPDARGQAARRARARTRAPAPQRPAPLAAHRRGQPPTRARSASQTGVCAHGVSTRSCSASSRRSRSCTSTNARSASTSRLGVRTLEYIEATRDDVALAERLMAAVGGATEDELPPRTRELVQELASYVEQRLREGSGRRPLLFSRREIREALGWGDTQLKTHLRRLVDAELVLVHRADHGRGIAYELAFSERSGQAGGATGGAESGQGRAEVGPRSAPASESNRADLQREPPSTVERAESALPGLQATAPRAAVSQAS
ncbi:MAG: hypothetical protein IPG04_40245 [Polyangiaceae bacterium]|nr:hypothetical protein [Polyangiaceae bacterium]